MPKPFYKQKAPPTGEETNPWALIKKNTMSNFRKQWNDTCKAAGLKPICSDTAARIMAIVYEFDREDITHCPKLLTDLKYIQNEYGIDGGKIPHPNFQDLFTKYAKEIEDNGCEPTEWAKKLMIENYNIKL